MSSANVVLLGPQRLQPTVGDVIADRLGHAAAGGHYAVVTAGWQEGETDDQELFTHLRARGGRMTNLALFGRAEDVFRRDPELLEGLLALHLAKEELRKLYRVRLAHALDAARELLAREEQSTLLDEERTEAIDDVRRIDASQLERLRTMQAEFDASWKPTEREHVVRHRAEIEGILTDCTAACVAGGHVLILLNRLRLFGLIELLGARPLFAWSAGAMALSDRVVLFHDSPPWGPGNAEVFECGMGLFDGIVPLPHAKRRLRLDDPVRVGLFARRFGPAVCAVLDEGTRVAWDGERWSAEAGTRRLRADGVLEEIGA